LGQLRCNTYAVLSDCVDRGVQYGYRRAYKYTDEPAEQDLCNCVTDAVISEICEYFSFHDPEAEE
jgi:predicted Zn-dependent protease with MMP-like domain